MSPVVPLGGVACEMTASVQKGPRELLVCQYGGLLLPLGVVSESESEALVGTKSYETFVLKLLS